jgi:DNA-binding transcriptional LysR family regulator
MDLNHLRTFYAVAQAGGFSRAEKALGVRQPAISKVVKALEEDLGVELLQRTRSGATLTLAGQTLLESCHTIFNEVARATAAAALDRRDLRGDLRIATNEHAATYLLPPAVAECRRRHPRLIPRIVTGASHALAREIAEGSCELGLFFFVERTPLLERRELVKVPCQIVVAKHAARDQQVLETFIGSREIDDATNKAFPTLRMLQAARPGTALRVSCNSLEAHKAMVRAGVGVSVLPLFMVQRELREKSFVVLHPEYSYLASLEVASKRGKVLSKSAKAFLQLVKAALQTRSA